MAVASAGPYASLHLTPDRQPCQHLTTQFFTGQMPFLPPNQQRQSTEGNTNTLSLNIFRPDALSDAQPTVAKHWRQQRQQQMHRYKTQPLGLLMYFRTTSKGENSKLKKSTKMNHITVSTIAIATKRRWCEALGLQRRSNGVIYMVSIQYMT